MSWKGLKKAVVRLPHMIQLKTGNVHTEDLYVDQEYDDMHSQFEELQQLTGRLSDAATKYREALKSMLKHQEQFSKVLMEVYEPIPGKFDGSATASQGLNSRTQSLKRNRALTDEQSLQRAQLFQQACSALCQDLSSQIDYVVDRGIAQPTGDLIVIHKQVVKTCTKRDHKKIDFDRHSGELRKLKANPSDKDDERKVVKTRTQLDGAQREFEKYNQMLKQQLPVYIHLRLEFIDPILVSLIGFQWQLFQTLQQGMQPLRQLVDTSCSATEGFERNRVHLDSLFSDISVLNVQPLSPDIKNDDEDSTGNVGGSMAAAVDKRQFDHAIREFDDEQTNPFYTNHPAAKNTMSAPISTNPYFPVVGASMLPPSPQQQQAPMPPPAYAPPAPGRPPLAVCLFDFEPQQAGDLQIKKGDRVEVLERTEDTNGWWRGRLMTSGEEGLFPGNYVRMV